jgi:hypothetical protein
MSVVKAKPPLPTLSDASVSTLVMTGLFLVTSALRSMAAWTVSTVHANSIVRVRSLAVIVFCSSLFEKLRGESSQFL